MCRAPDPGLTYERLSSQGNGRGRAPGGARAGGGRAPCPERARGDRRVRRGRGRPPPGRRLRGGRRRRSATAWSGDVVVKVAPPSAEEIGRLGAGLRLDRLPRAAHRGGDRPRARRPRRHQLRDGGDPADHARAVDGRALLAGHGLGLPRRADRRAGAAALLPDAHHRRRHGRARAKVLVLGAGVAGLQAIATARRLGAIVQAFDVRSAVKEQIESLGARFLELDMGLEDAEGEGGYARRSPTRSSSASGSCWPRRSGRCDAVISTAAVPGPPRAAARDRAGREEHEARLGDRRPRRRDRRQLRADRARPDGREGGRDDRRAAQPAGDDARPRLEPLRAQHPVAARADGRARRAS